jgi:prepilin-type N-terminal cleavage/methylation domain-containing protein
MRRGFTLIELIVTVAVLGVVAAITFPVFKSSRDRARATQCLSSIRQSGVLLFTYSDLYADHLPFAGRKPTIGHYPPETGTQTVKFGGTFSVWGGTWSLLFPHEWQGKDWNTAYQCPRQRRYIPSESMYSRRWFDFPFYWMTDVVGFDPVTMRKGSKVDDIKAAPNMLSNVRFPSNKVYLWEEFAFCTPHSDEPDWHESQGVVLVPTSVLLFDGSADRKTRNWEIPGLEGAMPYQYTVDGIYGRDVR